MNARLQRLCVRFLLISDESLADDEVANADKEITKKSV